MLARIPVGLQELGVWLFLRHSAAPDGKSCARNCVAGSVVDPGRRSRNRRHIALCSCDRRHVAGSRQPLELLVSQGLVEDRGAMDQQRSDQVADPVADTPVVGIGMV